MFKFLHIVDNICIFSPHQIFRNMNLCRLDAGYKGKKNKDSDSKKKIYKPLLNYHCDVI